MDIDQWGRIFCPEAASSDGVELSGIIFVAEDCRFIALKGWESSVG